MARLSSLALLLGALVCCGCQCGQSLGAASLLVTVSWDGGTFDQLHFTGHAGVVDMFPGDQAFEPTDAGGSVTSGASVRIYLPARTIDSLADVEVEALPGTVPPTQGNGSTAIARGDNNVLSIWLERRVPDLDGGGADAGGLDAGVGLPDGAVVVDGGAADAGANDGGTCAGCITASGACVGGNAPNACGTGGAVCVDCATSSNLGLVCVAGNCGCNVVSDCRSGQSCDVAVNICTGSCGGDAGLFTVCNGGCCAGTSCTVGNSSFSCGSNGTQCLVCTNASVGQACVTVNGSETCGCNTSADCPNGGACIKQQCSTSCGSTAMCGGGCCANGQCSSGTTPTACGATGGPCMDCTANPLGPQACVNGVCGCFTTNDCPLAECCNPTTHQCDLLLCAPPPDAGCSVCPPPLDGGPCIGDGGPCAM